jgi:integrase
MGKLIATQVKNIKKPGKFFDGHGLYLLVNKSGKYWRYDYRFQSRRKTLSLGVYPKVSLKEARTAHGDARELLDQGFDPSHLRKISKKANVEFSDNSFENIANEWLANQSWTEGHKRTVVSRLKNYIFPALRYRLVDEIKALDVLNICKDIEGKGAIETAHRVKTICSQVFCHCVATGRIESDPCRDLSRALKKVTPKHMAAITDPKGIGELLRAIEGYSGQESTKAALLLAPLVFVRPGELRHAEWSEIDVKEAIWEISADKMKMKRAHIVPLSKQAIKIINDIQPFTGKGRYIFPALTNPNRPMSDNTVNAALRRLGYVKEEMVGHGFRSMASTQLHELNQPSHLIEKQLAHIERNSVKAAYNHAEYLTERREMMQFWADYLDQLKDDKGKS